MILTGGFEMPKLAEEFTRRYVTGLRIHQIRVLLALRPENGALPPALSRFKIHIKCGFATTSGTVTRAMKGVREGSSSGNAFPGLIELGLVDVLKLDVDGLMEQCYQITLLGIRVLECSTRKLPEMRRKVVNKKYRKVSTSLDSGPSEIYERRREPVYEI